MQQYVANKCREDVSWQALLRVQVENGMQTLSEQLRAAFPSLPEDNDACACVTWHRCCKQQQQEKKQAAQEVRKKRRQKAFQEKKQRMSSQYNTQPRQVHRMIFGKAAGQAKMAAVNDTDGNVLNDSKQVSQFVHKFDQAQASPAFGPKTEKYLPGEVKRDYPWHTGGCSDLDPFTLETRVGDPSYDKVSVLDHICDSTSSSA